MIPSGLLLLLIFGLLIVIVLAVFLPHPRSWTKAPAPTDRPSTGTIFRGDDRYWLAGIFYNNPDDPDPFVPKRYGLGWTINIGHPLGKLVMAIIVGMLLLPLVLTLLGVHLTPIGCHPSGCYPSR